MDDRELLELLDRRAAVATAALDQRVAEVDAPTFDLARPRGARRRLAPLLAVAAVLAVAVAAASVLSGGGSEETTIAGNVGITHLVLPAPAAARYDVIIGFDGSAPPGAGGPGKDVPVTVQGPDGAGDPWAASVLEYSLPSANTTLAGEEVDIGGPSATLDRSGIGPTVAWDDGDVVRFLVSTRLSGEDLVTLARQVVAQGAGGGEPLPGHRVLFSGGTTDVFPVLAMANGGGTSGVVYRTSTGDDGFVVATVAGDEARWRAAYAVATDVEDVTIRGRAALIARYQLGLSEISWLEDDGTLVRVNALDGEVTGLTPVLDQLVEIDEDAFTTFVSDSRPPDDEQPSKAPGEPTQQGTKLAEVRTEYEGRSLRASIVDEAGMLTLKTRFEAPGGTQQSSLSLTDLTADVALRQVLENGEGVVVAGLTGPSTMTVEIRHATTGEVIDGTGPSTAVLPNGHLLFLGRIDPAWADTPLVTVGTTTDGTQIHIPFANNSSS